MRLHNEIVAFTQMLEPTAEEVASRAASLDALRQVVAGIWPSAKVRACVCCAVLCCAALCCVGR
jgi:DNA polymerase sigma